MEHIYTMNHLFYWTFFKGMLETFWSCDSLADFLYCIDAQICPKNPERYWYPLRQNNYWDTNCLVTTSLFILQILNTCVNFTTF
jgi:hypothetical protein